MTVDAEGWGSDLAEPPQRLDLREVWSARPLLVDPDDEDAAWAEGLPRRRERAIGVGGRVDPPAEHAVQHDEVERSLADLTQIVERDRVVSPRAEEAHPRVAIDRHDRRSPKRPCERARVRPHADEEHTEPRLVARERLPDGREGDAVGWLVEAEPPREEPERLTASQSP